MDERLYTGMILCAFIILNYMLKYGLIVIKGYSIDKIVHDTAFTSLLNANMEFYNKTKVG